MDLLNTLENALEKTDAYLDGLNDSLKVKIETLKPHPTEAIVLSFNSDRITLETLEHMFKHVESKFPENAVVAVPDAISLESCSKDVLENYISMIATIIEEL